MEIQLRKENTVQFSLSKQLIIERTEIILNGNFILEPLCAEFESFSMVPPRGSWIIG